MTKREDYFRRLEAHDWYYEMSDDHGAWVKGNKEDKALREEAKKEGFEELYEAFINYHNTRIDGLKGVKPRVR